MPKPFRVVILVIIAVVLIVVLGGGTAFLLGGRILSRTLDIPDEQLSAATSPGTVTRGAHLATIWGCTDCHTANLGGQVLIDEPRFARLAAPNLTAGIGGLTAQYALTTFEKAIRHGVGWNGRLLMVMPSMDYQHITDEDIAALFAYLKSMPPVDNDVVARELGPMGRFASLMSSAELFPGSAIQHDIVHLDRVEVGMTAEYGGYLAGICGGCHGKDYAGRDGNGPNLTRDPDTGLGGWSYDDFARAVRQGRRPDGAVLDSAMPWYAFSTMTEDEIEALWMYLERIEPKPGVARTGSQ